MEGEKRNGNVWHEVFMEACFDLMLRLGLGVEEKKRWEQEFVETNRPEHSKVS